MAQFIRIGNEVKYANESAVGNVGEYVENQDSYSKVDVEYINCTKEHFEEEFKGVTSYYGNTSQSRIDHCCISCDKNDRSSRTVLNIAGTAVREYLKNSYQAIMSYNYNPKGESGNPHIHIMFNSTNFNTGENEYDNEAFIKDLYKSVRKELKNNGYTLGYKQK